MGALPIIHFFRLGDDGARCGTDGLFVGSTPPLRRTASGDWEVRPRDQAEAELTPLYGLPIDLCDKQGGLATADPPKTLDELQQPPTDNVLGYLRRHGVERNPDNVVKSAAAATIVKFGRPAVDDPSDIVWVPTLKRERIAGHSNSLENQIRPRVLHRDIVDELDFADQRDAGLETLRLFGALQ